MTETVLAILAAHRTGAATPEQTVARCYARIRARGDAAVFITLRDEAEALAEARAACRPPATRICRFMACRSRSRTILTSPGCRPRRLVPAFSYNPAQDATTVARLRAAGAIVIGKTNLDQLATGLVGVRSPYGVPKNSFNDDMVPGGSSSGSAVAVASGLVPLSLGTDTAGSGRVPAGFNNIVGLKPSLGLFSTFGVVPACRTLDCVSVFALTVDDAWLAASVMAAPDDKDPYSRNRPLGKPGAMPGHLKLGVPMPGQREFFGDKDYEAGYDAALERLKSSAAESVEVDIEPLYETARLLYEGPWVAERAITAQKLLARESRRALSGDPRDHAERFAADRDRRLQRVLQTGAACARSPTVCSRSIDALVLPTAPTTYTVQQVLDDPILLNSRLGTYTNFVNLLDLCGLALPASMTSKGLPFGITLVGAGRRRCAAGRNRPGLSCRHQAAARRAQGAAARADAAGAVGCRRRNRGRGGRRAFVGPAAQRRTARARRPSARDRQDRARLQALCAQRHGAAEARSVAGRGRKGRSHRGRSLGAAVDELSARSSTASARHCRSAPSSSPMAQT